MKVRFYVDSATSEPHIWRHGVREEEVEEVLRAPGEDRLGKDVSRVCIGRTSTGRYLRVIYVPDSRPRTVFVITAYDLKGKALKAYRRRQRRRRQ